MFESSLRMLLELLENDSDLHLNVVHVRLDLKSHFEMPQSGIELSELDVKTAQMEPRVPMLRLDFNSFLVKLPAFFKLVHIMVGESDPEIGSWVGLFDLQKFFEYFDGIFPLSFHLIQVGEIKKGVFELRVYPQAFEVGKFRAHGIARLHVGESKIIMSLGGVRVCFQGKKKVYSVQRMP